MYDISPVHDPWTSPSPTGGQPRHATVDEPPGTWTSRPRTWAERGTRNAETTTSSGGPPERPLHLVFSGLTVPTRQAYRSWGRPIDTETPRHAPQPARPAGPERPPGPLGSTTTRECGSYAKREQPIGEPEERADDGSRDRQHGRRQDHGNGEAAAHGRRQDRQDQTAARHAGPWGASFDGTEPDGKTPVKGLTFERRWTRPGVHPYDEITWEYRTAGIANETRQVGLRAEGRRGPRLLEPARHQRRRQQVLPRPPRHARSARPASASSSIASSTRSRPGPRPSTTSRPTRTSRPSRPS